MEDITSLLNEEAVIPKIIGREYSINLKDYDYEQFTKDTSFNNFHICPTEPHNDKKLELEVTEQLGQIYEKLENFEDEVFYKIAVEEAIMNAFIHGNKRQKMPVNIGYKIDKSIDMYISDQGGEIDISFFPFVNEQQKKEGYRQKKNFYEFSSYDQPDNRGGTGILAMFYSFKHVSFFKNENEGLTVRLYEPKPKFYKS